MIQWSVESSFLCLGFELQTEWTNNGFIAAQRFAFLSFSFVDLLINWRLLVTCRHANFLLPPWILYFWWYQTRNPLPLSFILEDEVIMLSVTLSHLPFFSWPGVCQKYYTQFAAMQGWTSTILFLPSSHIPTSNTLTPICGTVVTLGLLLEVISLLWDQATKPRKKTSLSVLSWLPCLSGSQRSNRLSTRLCSKGKCQDWLSCW